MYRWRIVIIPFVLVALFLGVIARLYQIQVVSTRSFSDSRVDLIQKASEAQSRELLLKSGRGKIIDRYGDVFVGEENEHILVFPQSKQQLTWQKQQFYQLARILQYPYSQLSSLLQRIDRPIRLSYPDGRDLIVTEEQKKQVAQLDISGVQVVRSDGRSQYHQIGKSLMGQVARQPFLVRERFAKQLTEGTYSLQTRIGISGIEAAFDSILHGSSEQVLNYTHTRTGKPLHGAEVQLVNTKEKKPSKPKTVVTTLDKELQRRVEQVLKHQQVADGAVVVQDISNGDLLALASAPMDGDASPQRNPWDHRALMEATPGSIFKIVTTMAALEEGLVHPDSTYRCRGKWEEYHLTDSNPKGHGTETLKEAFADSCNLYFGQLSQRLGGQKLEAFAKQLGFGQKVLWSNQQVKQILSEHTGMIFFSPETRQDDGAVVQSGIGQRDVKITPLQAANLVTTLFHQGQVFQPRLVKEIREDDGRVVMRFPIQTLSSSKKMKPETLTAIQSMMRKAVEDGTAASVKKATWKLAAKTGTAQIGHQNNQYHKWMIGFGPVEKPRYSVAVVIRSVENASDPRANIVFQEVMNELAQLEKVRRKTD